MRPILIASTAALAAALVVPATLAAQTAPKFAIDAAWPKELPEGWITGQLGACAAARRIRSTSSTGATSPTRRRRPRSPRRRSSSSTWTETSSARGATRTRCRARSTAASVDRDGNVWVAGNADGIIQKYAPDGKLLLQIGTRGKFDSVDGTRRGAGLNAARDQLHMPAGMAVDPGNGDIYVADGYGNRRVAVFDKDGKFLRQWGRQATQEEIEKGAPGVFAQVVHCIAMSNAGLIYVCDRQGNRVQVFQKDGTFVRNVWIKNASGKLPDKRGTAWWVAFSPDREQKFMYVMNGGTEQVHALDHASGNILSSFGRPGHQIGSFTHGHTIAVDSQGSIYVAETDWGRRIQKFKIVQ